MKTIKIFKQTVTKCGECPRNKEVPNALPFFPPAHYCIDIFDEKHLNGKLILNPNVIACWCPHAEKEK